MCYMIVVVCKLFQCAWSEISNLVMIRPAVFVAPFKRRRHKDDHPPVHQAVLSERRGDLVGSLVPFVFVASVCGYVGVDLLDEL